MEPKIARSARGHGISDRRIREAYRNTVTLLEREQMTMHLGHDAEGVPLEIGVVTTPIGAVIVHAMRLRRSWAPLYRRFLP